MEYAFLKPVMMVKIFCTKYKGDNTDKQEDKILR